MERRVKKASGASKDKNRLRREVKDRENALQKLRKELIEVNKQNNGLNAALKDAKTSQGNAPNRPVSSVPRVAQQTSQKVSTGQFEAKIRILENQLKDA